MRYRKNHKYSTFLSHPNPCRDAGNRTRSPRTCRNRCDTLFFSSKILSGCWESNPVSTHPKRVYYRYTTARQNFRRTGVCTTGLPRSELGSATGVYYIPTGILMNFGVCTTGLPRSEPRGFACSQNIAPASESYSKQAPACFVHPVGFEPTTSPV